MENIPFRLSKRSQHRKKLGLKLYYTDGSVITDGKKKGRDPGPGGWAVVDVSAGAVQSGKQYLATNNEMELKAVVEAVRMAPKGYPIEVRTDSKYVVDGFRSESLLKSNRTLWKELEELCAGRDVNVNWVKGHAGDSDNERADSLAERRAQEARAETT